MSWFELLLVAMLLLAIYAVADYCDVVVLGVKSAVQCLNITTVAIVFLSFGSLFFVLECFRVFCRIYCCGVHDSFCVFRICQGGPDTITSSDKYYKL